jgi:Uma2 family endonuclease
MTTDELVALPDDHIDRWLWRGELRAGPRRLRPPGEAAAITGVANALSRWVREAKSERGAVLIDAWHRVARDPDTTLGINVSLIGKTLADSCRQGYFVDGVPLVAAMAHSPAASRSVQQDQMAELIAAGVPLVWLVNADFRTVWVMGAGAGSSLLTAGQTLTAEPHLPGFAVPVAELFD